MTKAIGICALLLAGAAAGADTYKWIDERGVVNYGETPPAGRPAKTVDTQPAATVETSVKRPVTVQERPVIPPAAPAQPALEPAVSAVRGMDFPTFIRLHRGMTEGELMLRAGRPDFESVENFRHDVVKSYYYYPTAADPFITVVSVRGGRIAHIERNRKMH